MQSPAQAARKRADGVGQRLDQPWKAARDSKVYFRRGQLVMIAAAPGVGKSVFALAYAVKSRAKTLYLSMDTDAFTTSVRLAAMETGQTVAESEAALARGDTDVLSALDSLENLSLAFPSNPGATEIVHRMNAYREVNGEYPDMLVIDNLQNIGVGDDEFGGQASLLRELQAVAVQTQTTVVVLHHATGAYDDGDSPLPQSGIRGKLSKFPAMILTLFQPNCWQLGVSVVKNRFGPASPTGTGVVFHLAADMSKAALSDADETEGP